MKNKPIRHKETNTFKFKRFADRISEIDVDIFHRVVHRNEEYDDPESLETNFYKTLAKWNVLNLTEGYINFRKEVRHIVTLPQLINNKEEVIDSLTKYLKMKNAAFLQPILDMVVSTAKDLQIDFYEYFPHFLTLIIDLLNIKDPEVVDYTFTTLAYLFKFLWRYLIKNIDTTFKLLLPLLVDSKPDYINNFAAESFAFVARKVRDQEGFLQILFQTLEQTPNGIIGCGKLLFEVISGTTGQFHSCAEQMLKLYLNALKKDSIDKKLVFDVLHQVFTCITMRINPKHSQIFWEVMLKRLDLLIAERNEGNDEEFKALAILIKDVVHYKHGRMLQDASALISQLIQSLVVYQNQNQVLKDIIDLSAAVLLAGSIRLTQETCTQLISKLLAIKDKSMLNYIVKKLINHSSFESLILPMALQQSVLREALTDEDLDLFAKIITGRVPPTLTGMEIHAWRRLNLDLRTFPIKARSFLKEKLELFRDVNNEENVINETTLKVIIIYPHIIPIYDDLTQELKHILLSIYEKLVNEGHNKEILGSNKIDQLSISFLLTLHSLIRIMEEKMFEDFLTESNIDFLKLIEKYSSNQSLLNSIDLFYTYISKRERSQRYLIKGNFDRLNESLMKQLGSPFTKIRLTVCHLYSLFENVKEIYVNNGEETEGNNLLKTLFMAENAEVSLQTYRDRLIHLQALSFGIRALMKLDPKYYECPLRFLLGNLYINFSLLWPPVIQAIASFADERCPQFWPIIVEQLKQNNEIFNNNDHNLYNFKSDVLHNFVKRLEINDKPDYGNYKVLLWKCLSEFPGYCESRNRDLTVLFIDFIENTFFKSNSDNAKSFSIEKSKDGNDELINKADDDDDEENIEDDQSKEKEKKGKIKKKQDNKNIKSLKLKKAGKPSTFKLLLTQLKLFSLMQNPRVMYKEAQLNQIYMDLLTLKSPELQKSVLDCIFAYKQKNLLPYKDHLYGLIDEKNLRNELARFTVADNEEGEMIQSDHREVLMPILMRIIYAKLVTRGSGRAAGAVGGLARRKIILRFLMGVREDEMILFAQMAFKPLERYNISLSPTDSMQDLMELTAIIPRNLDLSTVIAPQRLRSAINLLGIVIEEFGAKMSHNLLPRLLAMLICVLAEIKSILEKSENVLSGFLSTIKEMRTSCLGILTRFFAHFETYPWSPSEIDALFNVAVFPWLEKLPLEGIYSPTALLKLLATWSQHPRYFCLLVKHKDDDESFSCLPFIIKLLLNQKTHFSVASTIMEMIEKLLSLANYETGPEDAMEVDDAEPKIAIHPRNVIKVDAKAILPGSSLNYGSALLFPHVPDVLNYIKVKLRRSKMSVNRVETTVLSRISELNLDSDSSNVLLSLLLPILVRKAQRGESEQTILDLLNTIANLMRTVTNPEYHVRSILPLLFNISSILGRRALLALLQATANNISKSSTSISREIMISNASLLKNLNAMNEKWLEQPDYEKRIDAFSEINAMVADDDKSRNLSLEFGVAVLYNCYFFLKHETDLSLKDSSGQCLSILGPKLVKMYTNPNDRKYLIEDTILNLVRSGIRGKNDAFKFQSISFLGIMSMECSDAHSVFRDLHLLTNKKDPEVDFFENLQHLQLHRKTRALLRFCTVAKTLKNLPNTKTLTQFIFPVASSYLCNESFAGKNSVVDAAIETVGTICRLLPWYQYSLILKYYLGKLRNQAEFRKQIIRIIVAILDAFHYDVSKLKSLDKSLGKNEESENIDDFNTLVNTDVEEMQPSAELNDVQIHDNHVKVDSNELEKQKEDEKIQDLEDKNKEDKEEAEKRKIDIEKEAEQLLDEELAQGSEESEENEELKEEKVELNNKESELKVEEFVMEKQTLLSQSVAKKLIFDITHTYLPQLNRSILTRTQHEMSHKVNRKRTGVETEEEELMRVPIALALVKLLQKLPDNIIDRNLPGIFMKICTFLKSRLDSVRRVTREILQKIMVTLGPDYLYYLLKEMNSLLTKGFQIHVLAYTIHAVLTSLKPFLKPVHMTDNLQSILEVCKIDLFGLSAEEKEVAAITRNVSEAKSTKSFDIFHILGQFINESCLLDLIRPVYDVLNETHSHKTVRKVIECLRHTVLGLADNTFIKNDQMLIFLYGIVSKSIPSLNPDKKEVEKSSKNKIEKPDCFIIPPEPKSRTGIKATAKITGSTNDHVMLEFGLKLFHILLKREKIAGVIFKPYLNPFVPILADCLSSQHVKLSTLSLQCFNWVLKMDLEAVQTGIKDICSSIFKILHKFGAAGLGKGDNFDLVMAAFKTMSVIIRNLKDFEMSYDEVKVLVLYAEQDLYDSERQATAFNLLRAIIARRLNVFQIHRVMKKVAVLSITSESDNVRLQCRAVFYQFLMEYPLGKKLEKHLAFYLAQMSYELQPGRLSALEMVHSIISGFPVSVLVEQSELFFIFISARLVNDDDPICRKHAAACIKQIIIRVTHNQRTRLFDIVLAWFKDENILHRRLAAQLCGNFVTAEKDDFEARLETLLPLILQQFRDDDNGDKKNQEPGQFVRKRKKRKRNDEKIVIKDMERAKDHHAFQVLQMTLKISSNCPLFLRSEKYVDHVQSIAEYSQECLAHPHLWVRLAATQQIGYVLATINEDKLDKLIQESEQKKSQKESEECNDKVKGYIYSHPLAILRSLSLDLIAQLQPEIELEAFFDQVIKNLVFIARVIKTLPWKNTSNKDNDTHTGISIFWLMKRIRRCVNIEVTQNPKAMTVRTAAFKWIAGIVTTIPIEPFLKPILFQMMSPLVREMVMTEQSTAPLRQLAKEVAKMIKKKIGDEEYTRLLMKVQQKIDIKKAERKKAQMQKFVVDPEFAAKKKIAKQQQKKEAKKRKNSQMYGKKLGAKKRKRNVDLDII